MILKGDRFNGNTSAGFGQSQGLPMFGDPEAKGILTVR